MPGVGSGRHDVRLKIRDVFSTSFNVCHNLSRGGIYYGMSSAGQYCAVGLSARPGLLYRLGCFRTQHALTTDLLPPLLGAERGGQPLSGRVDVIIPTKDRPALTLEAAYSVIGQIYSTWTLFIVDDGSTRENYRELEKRLPNDHRIVLIRLETSVGASHARQVAFEAGDAPFVACLDSDDLWLPHKLEHQVQRLELTRADIVIGWHVWLHEDGTQRVARRPRGEGVVSPLFTNNMDLPLFRRSVLEEVGGFWNESIPRLADCDNIEFFIRCLAGANVSVVTSVLALCRDHAGPRMSDATGEVEGAHALATVIELRSRELEKWPLAYASILTRAAIRFLNVGDARQAIVFLRRAFGVCPRDKSAMQLGRQYGAALFKGWLRLISGRVHPV